MFPFVARCRRVDEVAPAGEYTRAEEQAGDLPDAVMSRGRVRVGRGGGTRMRAGEGRTGLGTSEEMPPALGRGDTSTRARKSAPTETAGPNPTITRWTKSRGVK